MRMGPGRITVVIEFVLLALKICRKASEKGYH